MKRSTAAGSATTFRGAAGEVVRGFVTPLTVLTAIPVVVATVVLVGVTGFFAGKLSLPPAIAITVVATSMAPVIGLFAMAGRLGNARAGFFEALGDADVRARVPGFVLRYGVLAAAWGAVLAFGAEAAGKAFAIPLMNASATAVYGAAMPGSPTFSPLAAIWTFVALVLFALLAPLASLLVATRADSAVEVLSPAAWRWLVVERGGDVVPFAASYVGGMTLFVLALVPVLAFFLPVAHDISPDLGQLAVPALLALPFAAAPILVGRLAGAFVAADFAADGPARPQHATPLAGQLLAAAAARSAAPSQAATGAAAARLAMAAGATARTESERDTPDDGARRSMAGLAGLAPNPSISHRQEAPTAILASRSPAGLPLGVALARANALGDTDPVAALADVEALRAAHGRNAAVAGEHARLLQKCGREVDARRVAGEAIRLALTGGAAPIAFDVFMAFSASASMLDLDAVAFEKLGRILGQRQELDGAAWCFRASASLGGDLKAAQKGVLGLADAALEADQPVHAAKIYEGFLRIWPDSSFASFAREGHEQAKRRIPAGVR